MEICADAADAEKLALSVCRATFLKTQSQPFLAQMAARSA
jgi:hypothetical protein